MEMKTCPAPPSRVLAAVTAADPYPFYATLREEWPFGWDPELGAFVAADAASVTAALAEPRLGVRPPGEPTPAVLAGRPCGEIFRRLVRQDDSEKRVARKAALEATLAALLPAAAEAARRQAARLLAEGAGVQELAFRLPVRTVAALLGAPERALEGTAANVEKLVGAWAAGATEAAIAAGDAAAEELEALFRGLAAASDGGPLASLFRRLAGDEKAAVANAVGLLTQAFEATAGLVAGTAHWLSRRPDLRATAAADPTGIPALVREIARLDPPVQNTRRYAGEDFVFLGQELKQGQMVLVLLAAACRDPETFPEPDRLDTRREAAEAPVWGAGRHACPGRELAVTLAAAATESLLAAGALEAPPPASWRPSPNCRIPHFGSPEGASP